MKSIQKASLGASKAPDSVFVLCAHSDDQILGVGGTMAKYSQEGKDVTIIVFSYGEKSHIWLKKRYIANIRIQESEEAGRIVGAKRVLFFNLEEGRFPEDFVKKNIAKRLQKLFATYKPGKVFTHSPDDFHPDHKALSKLILEFCDSHKYQGDVYCFDIWNPLNTTTRDKPRLVVNVTRTFSTKLKALRVFKSQRWNAISILIGAVCWRAVKNGLLYGCRFAEVFYKIR